MRTTGTGKESVDAPLHVRLREFRRQAGLTQYGLAQQLEVHPSTIFRWENGNSEPRARHWQRLGKLAKQFEIDLDLF